VFPWIEDEQAALDIRVQRLGRRANDYALRNFLSVLVWFRRVLLQDAALIYSSHPSCKIFTFPPFNTPEFKLFSDRAPIAIANAERDASIALQNLPEHVINSVRGIITDVGLAQQLQNNQLEEFKNTFTSKMSGLESMLALALGSKRQGRKPSKNGTCSTL
jgi:hypothetical protein